MNDDWARPADGTKSATKLKNGNQIEKWCNIKWTNIKMATKLKNGTSDLKWGMGQYKNGTSDLFTRGLG